MMQFSVFSHRMEVNFASLLDDKQCIALPDENLNILHAHVRADLIIALSLQCTFNMFAELEAYFVMHWRVLINQHGEKVGHPSGNPRSVGYLHYYGLDHDASKANLSRMAAICDNLEPYEDLSRFEPFGVRGMYSPAEVYNWSNIDLNLRYKPCPCCDLSMLSCRETCEACEM